MLFARLFVLCAALVASPVIAQAATWKVVRDGASCSVVATIPGETIRYLFATQNTPGELYIDGGPRLHTWKMDDGKVHRFAVDKDDHARIFADETMPNEVSWVDGHKLAMDKEFTFAMFDCTGVK